MPQVEFRHGETGRLGAQVKDALIVPADGDCIYAPSAAAPGAYAHYRVTGRELFYDQERNLTLVKLECDEVSS